MDAIRKSEFKEYSTRPTKSRTISERLSEAAKITFVGRQQELFTLTDAIQAAEPPFWVAFIHGPGGIGKSRLIQATLNAVDPEVRWYVMDCRDIEPTPEGFQMALGATLGLQESDSNLQSILGCLAQTMKRTVVALDTYETFGLMDTWLRQVFVPSLSDNVITMIASRQAPSAAWLTTAGWPGHFREIEVGEPSGDEAHRMLELHGLAPEQVDRVQRFARGYPLALEMAAAAIRAQPDLEIKEGPPPKILQQLTQAFLGGLSEEILEAVEAAATVRRVTEPLLRVLLDAPRVRGIFDSLQPVPFVDSTAEGLILHDVVRETISKDLAWRDPQRYRTYRQRAYSYLAKESHRVVARSLWQCTADMLYLIENPVVRDAFFPEGVTDLIVEPATASDAEGVLEISEATEPAESAQLIERWWNRHLETFSVAKTEDGKVVAFYSSFEPGRADRALLAEDPLTSIWLSHLGSNPLVAGERALFIRRWLDRSTGEAPSSAVGACFLDIKRAYMELRPSLRRIYTTVRDLSTFEPVLFPVGFSAIDGATVELGEVCYHSIMLDFGPLSVDGWLARIVGAELGIATARAEKSGLPDTRRLFTVLFTDIVGSTKRAVELGDSRWRQLLENHHALVRLELAKFGGHEIDTAGDGFLATFERPAQGIQCACSIRDLVRQIGLEIRAGLHLGECEAVEDGVRGIAVHIGARVTGMAGVGEVLVSSTLKDAMAGSGICFIGRGNHVLKGIPGEWRLYAVERDSVQ